MAMVPMDMDIGPAAPSGMTLYGVLHEDNVEKCQQQREVPTQVMSGDRNYIGFRTTLEDAIIRYRQIFGKDRPKNELAVLEVHFTIQGVVQFVTESCNSEHFFCPRLSKRTYRDESRDWGVWHFVGPLPLDNADLLTVEWYRVV